MKYEIGDVVHFKEQNEAGWYGKVKITGDADLTDQKLQVYKTEPLEIFNSRGDSIMENFLEEDGTRQEFYIFDEEITGLVQND